MRLTCPCCGATNSLEALLNDASARQAVARALSLPAALGPGLLRYLGMFRPPQRSLTWDRAAKLLEDLLTMIDAGQIQRNGRFWPAPIAVWNAALDEITARRSLELPLKSHGYLLEIIAGISNKAEARAEADQEQRHRQPRDRDPSGGWHAVNALLAAMPQSPPPEERVEQPEIIPPRTARRTAPPAEFTAMREKLLGKCAMPTPPAADETPESAA